jgi:hypothetical protein
MEARNELAATENEYLLLQQAWILQAQPGLHPVNFLPDPDLELRFQELVSRRYRLLEKKIGSFQATPHAYPEAPPLPAHNANKTVWKEYDLQCAYSADFWKAHATLKTAMLASLGPVQLRQLNHPHSDTSTLSAQDIFNWVTQRYGQLKVPDIIKVQELMKKKFSTLEEFHNDISEFRHCRNALIRCDSAISAVNLKIILIEKTEGNRDLKNLFIRAYERYPEDTEAVLEFTSDNCYAAFEEYLAQTNAVVVQKTGKVNPKKRKNQETSGAPPRAKAFCYYHSFDRPNNSHLTKDCRDMKKHASSFTDKQRNAVSYADCAYEVVKIGN